MAPVRCSVICSWPACSYPANRQAPSDFIKTLQVGWMCLIQKYVSFLMYLFTLSWLQIRCAITSSAQTLTYCHGSDSNAIHFLYLTPAMIKHNVHAHRVLESQTCKKHFIMAGSTNWRSKPCGGCLSELAVLIDALWAVWYSRLRSYHSHWLSQSQDAAISHYVVQSEFDT